MKKNTRNKFEKKYSPYLKKYLRPIVQIFFFIIAPGLFSAAFGAVKSMISLISRGEALEMTSFITTFILLLAFTWMFGRVFCGMACSFGALGDLVFFWARPFAVNLRKKGSS